MHCADCNGIISQDEHDMGLIRYRAPLCRGCLQARDAVEFPPPIDVPGTVISYLLDGDMLTIIRPGDGEAEEAVTISRADLARLLAQVGWA